MDRTTEMLASYACRLSYEDLGPKTVHQVKRTLGIFPGRVTYVIDGAGVVRQAFSSQLRALAHIDQALVTVRSLEKG